ncbi:MAG: hypothetical protein JWQ69_5076 [Pseudomonas sp.]|nr:hypothetical protein [Pseudomonas sp.]
MQVFTLAVNISMIISIGILIWLLKYYLPNYAKEKAKNLATKEDIAGITDKIESVKTEYAKQLELHKMDIWREQQAHLWQREEIKLKIDTFKKAVVTVAKLNNLILKHQMLSSSRELALAAAGVAKSENDDDMHKLHWNMYLQYRDKAELSYVAFRDVIVEIGELFALFSVYFNTEMSDSLQRILILAHGAIGLKMTSDQFYARLKLEYHDCQDMDIAREKVGAYYDQLCGGQVPTAESNKFFDLLKSYIKLAREETSQ